MPDLDSVFRICDSGPMQALFFFASVLCLGIALGTIWLWLKGKAHS